MHLIHSRSAAAVSAVVLLAAAAAPATAQEVPERELAKPNAVLKEPVRNVLNPLPLADGRLLFFAVGTGMHRADFTTGAAEGVLPIGPAEELPRGPGPTMRWAGDSIAVIDLARARLMILGPDFKYARSVRFTGGRRPGGDAGGGGGAGSGAPPAPRQGAPGPGGPGMPRGPRLPTVSRVIGTTHVVGRMDAPPVQGANPNAAPPRMPYAVVRMALATGTLDTLAQILPAQQGRPPQWFNQTGTMTLSIPPGFQHLDTWTTLSDGTVAILRAATYRFNFIALDGTRSESTPLPYPKLALSDGDKKQYMNDMKRVMEDGLVRNSRQPVTALNWAEPTVWPAQHPPFRGEQGIVTGTDDRMWLAVRCANDNKATCYDVIDRTGARVVRYRLPASTVVVAATADAVFTLNQQKSDKQLLQRHPL